MMRLQGTDGVRAPVALAAREDLKSLTPQRAFLDKGVITEEFMELYTFVRCRQLIDTGAAKPGEAMVIGWDPRDPGGVFTSAAVAGIGKSGLKPWTLGVAPTPLCPLYAQWSGAAGAIAITASHNPAVYNGIKIFTRRGLKLLPLDDVEFTRLLMGADYATEVKNTPGAQAEDHSAQAGDLYTRYHLDRVNSLLGDSKWLENVTLIVDAANGAMAPYAENTLAQAGFGRVMVANTLQDGSVNKNCGVAELEGHAIITAQMLAPGGKLQNNLAMAALFEAGRINPNSQTWAAVFDGDGDRLYLAIYDPMRRQARLLTGDDTAALMAWGHRDHAGDRYFVNTVESDLNLALAAAEMGYKTELTAVGDKWILIKAALELARRCGQPEVIAEIERHVAQGTLGADLLEKILDKAQVDFSKVQAPLFIGGEESGHSITTGYLRGKGGQTTPVYHGNGMKSLLNTSAWLATLHGLALDVYWPGFKKTLYAYHVEKALWRRQGDAWMEAVDIVASWAGAAAVALEPVEMIRPEEPDMLYIKLMENGAHIASVFIRSSGTEDKTGVSLRGPERLSGALMELGEGLLRVLMTSIKQTGTLMVAAEALLLRQAAGPSGAPAQALGGLDSAEYSRLLHEAAKQGLLTGGFPGARLTARGQWLLSTRGEA